jgi:hypothetical protein
VIDQRRISSCRARDSTRPSTIVVTRTKHGSRKRTIDVREILNGVLSTGWQWQDMVQ